MDKLFKQLAGLDPKKRQLLVAMLEEQGVDLSQLPIVPQRSAGGTYPLSFVQQQLWVVDQLEPGSPAYNLHVGVRLSGRLDSAALERSLSHMLRRHAVFRTCFPMEKGQPVQAIVALDSLPLPVVDLRSLPAGQRETVALDCATAEAHRPFDLARAPLLRTMLLRLDGADYMLLMTIHHIISDGWSLGVLVREIAALYDAFAAGRPAPLPDLPIQYVDFAQWQREWMQGQAQARQFAYWKAALREPLPRLELPSDRPRPRVQTFRGTHQTFAFAQSLAAALTALGQQENVTLFMLMLAAFNIVLHYYTGGEDIVVGTDVANRNRAEVQGLIGFFVNQLVLRSDLSGNPTCRELIQRVRRVALGAYAHQEFPFAKLVELLNPARSLQYAPMFQVKLVLQNAPIPTFDHADLTMTPLDVNITTSQLDLILSVAETERGLEGELEYNVDLFDAARINRLLEHFEAVLSLITAWPDHTLSAIEGLLAEADNRRLQLQEEQCLTASQQRLKLVKRKATQVVAKEERP